MSTVTHIRPDAQPSPEAEERLDSTGLVVGVVEDSDEDFAVLTRSLRRTITGAVVRRWARAEAMLEELAGGLLHGDGRPTAVIVDLSLPGIDGCELVRRLRADDALHGLPLFMFSGSSRQLDIDRCRAAGADDYFRKSTHREDVQALLRAVVDAASGAQGGRTV